MQTDAISAEPLRLPPGLSPERNAVLRSAVARAQILLTREALQHFVDGAELLRQQGLSWAPIVAYLEQVPAVMRRVDETILAPLLKTACALHQRGGERAIDQLFSLAATVAARYSERDLFAQYLAIVQELAAVAPNLLPVFFDHLPAVLEHLTVNGLQRWVRLGTQIHSRDTDARKKYFALESADSLAVLKLEGEGTLFSQMERRLRLYLRALWDRDVTMRPKAMRDERIERHRPFLDGGSVYFPDAYPAHAGGTSVELYRAAAAHAAAHLAFTPGRIKVGNYKPIKIIVVSLLEDARVELLAIRTFPGLRDLWGRFHTVTAASGATFEVLAARLARALLDPEYPDDSPWVARGRNLVRDNLHRLHDPQLAVELASPLANDIGQMRLQFNFKTYAVQPPYRDDHSFLWDYSDADTPPPQLEDDDDIVVEEQKTNPQEAPQTPESELKEAQVDDPDPDKADQDSSHTIALEMVVRSVNYAEWDYLIGMERPAWCTLFEKQPVAGNTGEIDEVLRRDDALLNRIKALIRGAQIQRSVRLRKQHDGDRIDLDQAIRAAIDLRSGHDPDPRINMRSARRGRDLAVLVLMDLSKSTGDFVAAAQGSVLELEKEAVALLAEAMHDLGDKFALHGFTSNGRRDVTYYRFKDFDAPYDSAAKSYLAGAQPQLSTRMGPAIRHAGQWLRFQACERKLLLMITDGEPSDVDVYDRDYLTYDAKKAVESLTRYGVHSFCLSLDPKADRYVSKIFGARNYLVVDKLRDLPSKLPFVYMRVTQH